MSHIPLTSRNFFVTLVLAAIAIGTINEVSHAIRRTILVPIGNMLGGEINLKIGPFDIGQLFNSTVSGIAAIFTGVFVLWLFMHLFWGRIAKWLLLENNPPES